MTPNKNSLPDLTTEQTAGLVRLITEIGVPQIRDGAAAD
jgi:hypothetical protein